MDNAIEIMRKIEEFDQFRKMMFNIPNNWTKENLKTLRSLKKRISLSIRNFLSDIMGDYYCNNYLSHCKDVYDRIEAFNRIVSIK